MKLKKRLSALFFALFLAFCPLLLAVPVNADSGVLSEPGTFLFYDSDTELGPVSLRISASVLYPNAVAYVDPFQNLILITWPDSFDVYVSLTPISSSLSPSPYTLTIFPYTSDGLTLTRYTYSDFELSSNLSLYLSDPEDLLVSPTNQYSVSVFLPFSTRQYPFSADFYLFQYYSAPDVTVLSVFSGVSSWLGGAVNNMISMFYTAESGLTVLGVLALASLALAFILLLIYLIAGWLKFR